MNNIWRRFLHINDHIAVDNKRHIGKDLVLELLKIKRTWKFCFLFSLSLLYGKCTCKIRFIHVNHANHKLITTINLLVQLQQRFKDLIQIYQYPSFYLLSSALSWDHPYCSLRANMGMCTPYLAFSSRLFCFASVPTPNRHNKNIAKNIVVIFLCLGYYIIILPNEK